MNEDEIERFDEELAEKNFQGQWTLEMRDEKPGDPPLQAHVWDWESVHEMLMKSVDVISLEELPQGTRRNVGLVNPIYAHDPDKNWSSKTIKASIQIVMPGEIAKAHRHTLTAFRFVIQGQGEAYSTVNGESFPMHDGDLVLTPRGTWHDHKNHSDNPVIWLDGLDIGFMQGLGATKVENYAADQQLADKPEGYHAAKYGVLRSNTGQSEADGNPTPPPYRYPWEEVESRLQTLAAEEERNPFEGYLLEYANPATGQPPTLASILCRAQLLDGGMQTERHRHNTTELYHVVEGRGRTEVGDDVLAWTTGDTFIVPPNEWHAHRNDDDAADAILFSLSDRPIFKAFNLYEEESESQQIQQEWVNETEVLSADAD